jgi:hypothetical protein
MAVIKINLGGMRVRINILGGMAVICRTYIPGLDSLQFYRILLLLISFLHVFVFPHHPLAKKSSDDAAT